MAGRNRREEPHETSSRSFTLHPPHFINDDHSCSSNEKLFIDGGYLMERALKLLAASRSLNTLKISFQIPEVNRWKAPDMDLFKGVITPQPTDPLRISLLSRIKGISGLEFAEMMGSHRVTNLNWIPTSPMNGARIGLKLVRKEMKSGHVPREDSKIPSPWSNPFIDQFDHSTKKWQGAVRTNRKTRRKKANRRERKKAEHALLNQAEGLNQAEDCAPTAARGEYPSGTA